MFLSIIVPVYNVEIYLERCLNSIILQQDVSSVDFEVIIINDGSPDNSLAIAERVTKGCPNIKILSQINLGLSAARNAGISEAKGDYIWCIDSDDWIEPDSVRYIIDELAKGDVDFLTISARMSDTGKLKNVQLKTNDPIELLISQTWAHEAQYNIYSRKFLLEQNLSFKPGIFHEDSEFTPRMMYLAKSCRVTNKVLYNMFCNPTSITHSSNPKKSYDNIIVAASLSKFMKDYVKEADVKRTFNDIIAIVVNNALNNVLYHSIEEKAKFNKFFYENRKEIIPSLAKARQMKYKIENILFRLFPMHYVRVYQMLCILK